MAEKIQLGENIELWQVGIDELHEQDINARSMPAEMFQRLTDTIKRDGRMESLPFCAVKDNKLEIISGHHRVRAARSAGIKTAWVLVDTSGLTQSQIAAKQIAHNAISGSDDPALLLQIFASINTIDDKLEAFVKLDDLKDLKKVELYEVAADFKLHSVLLLFVPLYYEKWQELAKAIPAENNEIALADVAMQEKFRDALKAVGKTYDVRAVTPIVCKMIDLYAGDKTSADGWAYTADILGPRIPIELAEKLQKHISGLIKGKTLEKKSPWRLLESLLPPG